MAVFSNTATLSYNNNTITSNTVTGEITEVLSISKTAVGETYGGEEAVTYIISVVNSGATEFSNLTLTDNLGEYSYNGLTLYPLEYVADTAVLYVNGSLRPAPTAVGGPPLSISGITVPPGGNTTIIYRAKVGEYAHLGVGAEITNTATLTGGGLAAPISDSETVSAEETSKLSITKSLCPAVVTENGTITYSFTIQNYGAKAVDASDNATVSDNFDPILRDISVSFNNEAWVSPTNYTYDTQTGAFATVAGQITVPAATFVQGADGKWTQTPGVSVLTVTGTV